MLNNFVLYLILSVILAHTSKVMATPIKWTKLEWTLSWEFNARELSLDDGTPSKPAWLVQPRIARLDFFGFLGSFPSQNPLKQVGFALVKAPLRLPSGLEAIGLVASTSTPERVFILSLYTQDSDAITGCSFQTRFQIQHHPHRYEFKASQFQKYCRGQPKEEYLTDFEAVVSVAFMITRSSQLQQSTTLPFDFMVWDRN